MDLITETANLSLKLAKETFSFTRLSSVDDSQDISPTYKQALKTIIKTEFKTDKYTTTIEAGSNKGDNYLGVIHRIQAKRCNSFNSKKKDDCECDNLSLILKVPPTSAARREQFRSGEVFSREALVYDKILPLFTLFQQSREIDPSSDIGFHENVKCYKSISMENEEALIFNDIKTDGFEMFDRHLSPTYEHAKLVMKALGKFHAISFALKDQANEKIEPYKSLGNFFFIIEGSAVLTKKYVQNLADSFLDTLDDDKDKHLKEKLNKFLEVPLFDRLKTYNDADAAEPYSVFNHGDCWNNNLMYKNENGIPVRLRLLDWQIARYCSPVADLAYYFFTSTHKSLRDKHYNDLLSIYYASLSKLLKRLGTDPEKAFPWSAFQVQLKEFGGIGLAMAFLALPFFTASCDIIPDFDKISKKVENNNEIDFSEMNKLNTTDKFKERMRDVLQDVVDLGYI